MRRDTTLRAADHPTARLSDDDWAAIRTCPLFRHLRSEAVMQLGRRGRPVHCERGQVIFNQGDKADAFFVLLEGWVKLYRLTLNGGEAVVTVLTRGESFAEPVMFLGGQYPVVAEAASSCRLLRMELASFVAGLKEDPELATAMLSSIALHGSQLTEQIEKLKLLNGPRRVAEFFINLAPAGQQQVELTLPYEKSLIAARLGMTPESFSRALAALGKEGVVVHREIVTIESTDRLRVFAGA